MELSDYTVTKEYVPEISAIVQKLMLQLTHIEEGESEPVCVGIVLTTEVDGFYRRHMMSLDEDDLSDWSVVREKLSLTHEELIEVTEKFFDAKKSLFKFKDYLISDMFFLSEPIGEVKNSTKTPYEIMSKHFEKEACSV